MNNFKTKYNNRIASTKFNAIVGMTLTLIGLMLVIGGILNWVFRSGIDANGNRIYGGYKFFYHVDIDSFHPSDAKPVFKALNLDYTYELFFNQLIWAIGTIFGTFGFIQGINLWVKRKPIGMGGYFWGLIFWGIATGMGGNLWQLVCGICGLVVLQIYALNASLIVQTKFKTIAANRKAKAATTDVNLNSSANA